MRVLPLDAPLDLHATLGPLSSGFGDPSWRFASREALQATRTPDGPATLHLVVEGDSLRAEARGPGAAWALEQVPELVGMGTPPPRGDGFPPVLRRMSQLASGVRLARTHRLLEALVPIVLQQLVTGREAARAFANLVRHASEPAPGSDERMWLPLGREQLLAIPDAAFTGLGALPRQGRTLHEIARRAKRIEACDGLPGPEVARRLESLPGVGTWTTGELRLRALGDPDAVPLGDFHLPTLVAFQLAGEEKADDARMLELLEPYRPHRGWVVRWLVRGGKMPKRRSPRPKLRPLTRERGTGVRPSRLR